MSPPDLSTTVAGIPLQTCLYNASGPRSGTSTALSKICESPATGAVLSKSATVQPQAGNPQPRTYHLDSGVASFNSEGLPNNGIDYYISKENIDEILGDSDKPYIVSLSGKTLADNLSMIQSIANRQNPRIRAIELNLACPNIIGKPIIAYDVPQMKDILHQVQKTCQKVKLSIPLGVKLAPYLDMVQLQQVAALLNEFKSIVKYIVTINTIGNALCLDMYAQQPIISSNGGLAGLSGTAVHYTALANVRQFRQLLHADIDVVGVGGVSTGEQAAAMLLAGACAVQLGTVHWKEGPACFERVAQELQAYMAAYGFDNIRELQASLSLWTREGAQVSRANKKLRGGTSKQTTTASVGENKAAATEGSFFPILSAVLAALVALLLAEKAGFVIASGE